MVHILNFDFFFGEEIKLYKWFILERNGYITHGKH